MLYSKTIVLVIIKLVVIFVLLGVSVFVGSIPLRLPNLKTNRVKAFLNQKKILSFTSALVGGMFLAIGLIQVLPRAVSYFPSDIEDFPIAQLITLLTLMFFLALKKILLGMGQNPEKLLLGQQGSFMQSLADNEQIFKETISTQIRVARQMSAIQSNDLDLQLLKKKDQQGMSQINYFLIQICFGVQSIFEGFAIGLEDEISNTLVIFVAMTFEKWSESLALGFAYRSANVEKKICYRNIIVQGLMTPLGLGIAQSYYIILVLGWSIQGQNQSLVGVFYAMAAGAFLYQATLEIIVEEFNIARFKLLKFFLFLFSVGLVAAFWPIEQNEFI